jgi:hypothetical protein
MKRPLAVAVLLLLLAASPAAGRGPSITGGSRAQVRLLRHIVRRMAPVHFASVELLRAREQHWSVRYARTMFVRFRAPNDDLRSQWEEWLAVGAFRDLSGKAKLPSVGVAESWGGGKFLGAGRISWEGRVRAKRATAAAVDRLRRRVLHLARNTGAHVEHLAVVRPYGIGYAVVLRVDRPARYLRYRLPRLLTELEDRWTRYEGAYFEVVDREGRRVWVTAGSSRLSTGAGWVRPDLEGCSPTSSSGSISHKVPRCPV